MYQEVEKVVFSYVSMLPLMVIGVPFGLYSSFFILHMKVVKGYDDSIQFSFIYI